MSTQQTDILILDIEGTTTPITFVADILFPYIRKNVKAHLSSTFETEQTQQDIEDLRKQATEDEKSGLDAPQITATKEEKEKLIDEAEANVVFNMDRDRKITALKQLQGHMWDKGYASGELKGQVYPDVHARIQAWKKEGKKVYIYSSGSVQAQVLLFKYSEFGDMTTLLDGNYDTKFPGLKTEEKSYDLLARDILKKNNMDEEKDRHKILFVTDSLMEAQAAKKANVRSVLSIRPNTMLYGFDMITSFSDIKTN